MEIEASHTHQHPADGPTAREEAAGGADRLTGGKRPGQDSRPGAAHPRNTSGFFACSSTSERGGLRSPRAVANRVCTSTGVGGSLRSEEHTSELQSRLHLVCRLLLEKKKTASRPHRSPC